MKRAAIGVAAAAGLAALVSGCTAASGGGTMAGVYSPQATFGVGLNCNGNGYLVGNLTYHDGPLSITAKVPNGEIPCANMGPGGEAFYGLPYTSTGRQGSSGVAFIDIYDSNQNGAPDKGDYLSIYLYDNNLAYANSGPVLSGNLKVK